MEWLWHIGAIAASVLLVAAIIETDGPGKEQRRRAMHAVRKHRSH